MEEQQFNAQITRRRLREDLITTVPIMFFFDLVLIGWVLIMMDGFDKMFTLSPQVKAFMSSDRGVIVILLLLFAIPLSLSFAYIHYQGGRFCRVTASGITFGNRFSRKRSVEWSAISGLKVRAYDPRDLGKKAIFLKRKGASDFVIRPDYFEESDFKDLRKAITLGLKETRKQRAKGA